MRQSNGRLVIGVILVFIGLMYLADNFFFFPWAFRHMVFSWPAILVLIGIVMLLNSRDSHAGIILIIIGGALLTFRYYHIPFSQIFREYWPVLLILLGFIILLKPGRRIISNEINENIINDDLNKKKGKSDNYNFNSSEEFINEVAILSGAERRIYTHNFRGGKITAIFGGAEIDLRDAKLAEGRQVIDVLAIFGGVDISVPRDWKVVITATSIFGGIDDERRKETGIAYDESRVLEIRGTVLFAGIDLKN